MHPTDNGQGSRRLLLPKGFAPPSQVHSEKPMPPHSHQLAALWIHPIFLTSLAQQFQLDVYKRQGLFIGGIIVQSKDFPLPPY